MAGVTRCTQRTKQNDIDRLNPFGDSEDTMKTVYVIKTGEQYLHHAEDGDIGMAPEIDGAMSFSSREEAERAANEHAPTEYEIVAISVKADKR